jgi:hypothetical protein
LLRLFSVNFAFGHSGFHRQHKVERVSERESVCAEGADPAAPSRARCMD